MSYYLLETYISENGEDSGKENDDVIKGNNVNNDSQFILWTSESQVHMEWERFFRYVNKVNTMAIVHA